MLKLTRFGAVTSKIMNQVLKDSPVNYVRTVALSTPVTSGDMYSKEDTLPHLPVPNLIDTMERYVKSLEPITFENDLEDTKQIVNDFVKEGGVGEVLQSKLIEKASTSDNWLAEWWDHTFYFGDRYSVVIRSSPGGKFPDRVFHSEVDQYRFTAKLIHSVLKFKHLVDTEMIPVEYAGKDPVSMVQYNKLLSVSRVPLAKCDENVSAPPHESRHVIVAHNNHFFSLDVYQEGGTTPLSEEELMQQLASIVNSSRNENEYPVGVLTTENRNRWAQAYKNLIKNARNKANIRKIESSICLICLDQPIDIPDAVDSTYENAKSSVGMAVMLHGGGSSQNSMNRWADKSLQFIVNRNGLNGFCYENSVADGPPLMVLCNMIMANTFVHDYSDIVLTVNEKLKQPEELSWNLTYDIVDRIELAMDGIDDAVGNIELRLFQFDDFGKNVPKSFRISPDAFFQVSLLLAYWRVHNHHPPSSEIASIRKFARGRNECIRSATPAATRFAREMDRANYNDSGKRDLFMKAVNAHVDCTIDAMQFQAVDSHMLGLKLVALENAIALPEIFRDKSFGYAMHFRLFTSQVPSKHEVCVCFGPDVPDGYGVSYNPMEHQFIYAVSAFLSHPKTQARDFGNAIAKALQDVQKLLATGSHL